MVAENAKRVGAQQLIEVSRVNEVIRVLNWPVISQTMSEGDSALLQQLGRSSESAYSRLVTSYVILWLTVYVCVCGPCKTLASTKETGLNQRCNEILGAGSPLH